MLFTNQEAGNFAKDPAAVRFHDQYLLYYSLRHNDVSFGIGISVSDDLEQLTASGEILRTQSCEANCIAAPGAIALNGQVHLFIPPQGMDGGMRSDTRDLLEPEVCSRAADNPVNP